MYDSSLTPLRMARLSRGLPQFVLAKRARLAAYGVPFAEVDTPRDGTPRAGRVEGWS